MKNSIVAILAIASMVACKKTETTTTETSTDTTAMAAPADNAMTTDTTSTAMTNGEMGDLSAQDKMFVDAAAKGGMMEVMMGKLAATNASSASVKSLGSMIEKDHTAANEELKSWAMTAKYTLPTSLNSDQQMMYDELKMKKGADFDRAYVDMMVTDHKKDIAAFEKEASEGKDASVKGFASKTLPTLKKHHMEAEKVKASMK
ncbi:hypothetical protein ASG01_12570 [Chryseobacterium sp. Leaf180]|uniref:DUF4142 domain-containing protein n=1 Tax=Chryseobacterium sp. Leaf180 TaxID=1736289 RepID=UPI000700DDDC|nr:DUF4142 domain-containing protein [Chryseobacterium sp. Leaf180]KQR91834.1 hypothetical protein ASG01_12570 [Chryseobacterium sp. Leaf180]